MKILIMGFGKLKFMPYMNFYLNNLNKEKNQIHLLCWNRDLAPDVTTNTDGITIHQLNRFQKDDVPIHKKLTGFFEYRRFALRLLKKEHYDFIFVVHSPTGVLVYDYLKKHYTDRLVFDYRDTTFEQFAPFKKLIGSLVNISKFTFISSDAFRKLLPAENKGKIFTIHNIDDALSTTQFTKAAATKGIIKIGFWGFIRDEALNKQIISSLGNDARFELHYYGREQEIAEQLKRHTAKNSFSNIYFHGEYNPEQKAEFIEGIDLIHNIYDDKNAMVAVGNKYYDGITFGIPQACMEGSFMAELCLQNGLGFHCNPYSSAFADTLFDSFNSVDMIALRKNCSNAFTKIIEENEANKLRINEF